VYCISNLISFYPGQEVTSHASSINMYPRAFSMLNGGRGSMTQVAMR
jgi:hypothetical protein